MMKYLQNLRIKKNNKKFTKKRNMCSFASRSHIISASTDIFIGKKKNKRNKNVYE